MERLRTILAASCVLLAFFPAVMAAHGRGRVEALLLSGRSRELEVVWEGANLEVTWMRPTGAPGVYFFAEVSNSAVPFSNSRYRVGPFGWNAWFHDTFLFGELVVPLWLPSAMFAAYPAAWLCGAQRQAALLRRRGCEPILMPS